MARMFEKKGRKERSMGVTLLSIVFSILLLAFLLYGIGTVGSTTQNEGKRAAEQAVRRAAVQCYALEGRFPQDIAYLEEHYGLLLNEKKYLYYYHVEAMDLMPDIRVFTLEEGQVKK
ncbi:hypothetical protein LJC20_01715 [Eubacteriales bacterium OttesenSCG-928-M02]|nr:hypothetical protein [Eubacteriales bacterium OttesenSCG-928-M02]